MIKLRILLRIIGIVQLILGLGFLFFPAVVIQFMKLPITPNEINYLFGMLAARFVAYGIGMFVIARDPEKYSFWVKNMLLIQVIDLAVGLFYTINGTLSLAVSAFPMFNAFLFAVLLFLWRPQENSKKMKMVDVS